MVLSQNPNKAVKLISFPELSLLKHILCQEIKPDKTRCMSNKKALEQDDNILRV